MNEGGLVFELVTDSSGLEGLEVDWNSLWQSTANSRYELSHSVVWHSWRTVAKPQGHGLCTVVGRIDGRVVLIWPAILRQEKLPAR